MDKMLTASPSTLSARHADIERRLDEEAGRPRPDSRLVAELKRAKLQIKDALAHH